MALLGPLNLISQLTHLIPIWDDHNLPTNFYIDTYRVTPIECHIQRLRESYQAMGKANPSNFILVRLRLTHSILIWHDLYKPTQSYVDIERTHREKLNSVCESYLTMDIVNAPNHMRVLYIESHLHHLPYF